MITVTDSAKNQILSRLASTPVNFVRLSVSGGGCAGFSYTFILDTKNSEDFVVDNVIIDPISSDVLGDATVDYKDGLNGAYFYVIIPQAISRCGCGSSFAV